jgi:ferredoxin-NADP reductase
VEDIVRDAEKISVHIYYSVNDAGEDISNDYSAGTLGSIIPDKKSLFYLCGPQSFTNDTDGYLKSLGVQTELIQIGNFGPLVMESN